LQLKEGDIKGKGKLMRTRRECTVKRGREGERERKDKGEDFVRK
jgi:hypothetical protein